MRKDDSNAQLPDPPRRPNRYLAALKDDVHKVGLAAVVAAWAASGLVVVPLAALVAEAAYLLFVPESSWFRRRLEERHRAAEEAYRRELEEHVLPQVSPDVEHSYHSMLRTREAIGKSVAPDDTTAQEMLRQLDYMLEKYLLFAHQMVQYHLYLARLYGDRGAQYDLQDLADRLRRQGDEQMVRLRAQLERATDDHTRNVVQENMDVLAKKQALIQRIAALANNLALHLQLFRNSFDLVGGLVQTRAPGEILPVISEAISKAELTATLAEQSGQIEDEIRQLRLEVLSP